jgi:hypothetical protein
MKRRSLLLSALSASLSGCVGTTGGDLLELEAAAAGPIDATGGVLAFRSSLGYRIELKKARLFVGGIFLNRARPTSVSSDTSCTLAGTYVGELLSGREVDLLSPEPQPFPERGLATTDRAQTAEVWLTAGDVNRASSATVILRVVGVAERDGATYPFRADLTIGEGRRPPATDPALPGQHPICKQRIVSPIPVDLAAAPNRRLLLRVDPRGMFANVDFSTLEQSDAEGYRFADEAGVDQASDNLYAGMRRPTGVYSFSWLEQS